MAGNVVDEQCCCDNEKPITILSIDGGGVRGIIPGKILEFLEKRLQLLDGPGAKIYEYFDIISGTSTGGLIAAMLATPKPNSDEPIIDAKDICQFYIDEAPKIFSNKGVKDDEDEEEEDDKSVDLSFSEEVPEGISLLWQLKNPKYNGEYLWKLIREKVGERKIADTLTNVLITTFDLNKMEPAIFSTVRAKAKEIDNVLMSDVGISTSAAPVFFPPYYFKNSTETEEKEFHLADGGLAANNPTLLGIGEIAPMESKGKRTCSKCSNQVDKFLVLSLGTGAIVGEHLKVPNRKWGILGWVFAKVTEFWKTSYPIIDAFSNASDRMVDIYTTMYLQDKMTRKDNFLRVQYKNLPSDQAILDNAKPGNLKNLVQLGEDLLKKHVVSVDLVTGHFVEAKDTTYEEALIKFARRLSETRRLRLEKM